MSGVTHFEKRGGRRKVHPSCPFCAKVRRVTTLRIVDAGGRDVFIMLWSVHVAKCVQACCGHDIDRRIKIALEHMASFGSMVDANL